MTPQRATSLHLRTVDAAEPSFTRMLDRITLEARADAGGAQAFAVMPWKTWQLIIKNIENVRMARALGGVIVTIETSPEPQAAAAVRLGWTSDGLLRVAFLDRTGNVYAYADMTDAQTGVLIGQATDLLEIISKGGLAMTACKGTA